MPGLVPRPPPPPGSPPPGAPPTQVVPNAPTLVRRGAGVPGLLLTTYIHVVWTAPAAVEGNNIPVTSYELTVESFDKRLRQRVSLPTPAGGGSVTAESGHLVASTAFGGAGADGDGDGPTPLAPGQRLWFTVAACNAVGCGPASAPAVELSTEALPEPFPWAFVFVPIVVVLLAVIGCWLIAWYTDLPKVIAPKLRKKKGEKSAAEVMSGFVSHDAAPMEDHDPEIVMNPVLLAKMERGKSGKGSKKASGSGRVGALKHLGIVVDANPKGEEERARERQMKDVDKFLTKEGVDIARSAGGGANGGGSRKGSLEPGANGGSRKGSAILTAASRKTSTKDASGLADLEAGPGVSRKVSAKFSEVL
jgi:hypothetical protein